MQINRSFFQNSTQQLLLITFSFKCLFNTVSLLKLNRLVTPLLALIWSGHLAFCLPIMHVFIVLLPLVSQMPLSIMASYTSYVVPIDRTTLCFPIRFDMTARKQSVGN